MAIQVRADKKTGANVAISIPSNINNPSQALLAVQIKMSAVPTTAGKMTVSIKSKLGDEYSGIDILNDDPSSSTPNPATDNYLVVPEMPIPLANGDSIEISYPNSDNLTVTAIVKFSDSYY